MSMEGYTNTMKGLIDHIIVIGDDDISYLRVIFVFVQRIKF